ncbi:tail assembly chaperone [Chromobacterium subtsugae]|uniref:Tail assembly chaperone n=1 Tax=Chromobacterium subtsugae TaxID=251747 RepID=A0ABS7FHU6_9NEIS|nr:MULTISPECIES: tail assembly chaperone [Chromobacterium]KUM02268.1 hypothetical protein Cv017_03875 [Chromobacterium subtsugae]KZE86223.1 hypothetical protein AWB61_16940 [Chromobacterium sp. F49]MBW7568070.1 tail assembly chaperone [Chromobacterium subtsugae]MBW8289556.1 tail assembly chaperone [Chromobacterium subtsugae]WSE91982.1 tail assembly chaperone [Chromobacterium subtsugae]
MDKQKTVYSYHPETYEYLGPSQADLSPLDPGEVWLLPACSTEAEPPPADEHQVPVFRNGDWTLQPDWRAVPLWRKQTAQAIQAQIGDTPDSLQATALSPPPFAIWRGDGWSVDEATQLATQTVAAQQQLQRKLAAAYQSRRPLEDASELGVATTDEQARLMDWKRYCVALSRLPQHPGWPRLADADWPNQPA